MSSNLNIRKLSRELNIKPNEDDLFFKIVFAVSNLSTGTRKQGAILVRKEEGAIISSGFFDAYNDPSKDKKSEDYREFGSGAIENCIANCAKRGVCSEGSSLYVYTLPNIIQCKLLIRSGIKEIHCIKDIPDNDAHKICLNNIKIFIHNIQE